MELTTKRFVLRDFDDGDQSDFVAYHADPRSRELYGPGENTPEHAAELVQLFKSWAVEEPRQNYQFAVVRLDGRLVGCAGLRMKNAGPGRAELGVELAPTYWGQFGYAIEIMKCLVDYGFRNFNLAQIVGSTVSENRRVARLAMLSVPCRSSVPPLHGWKPKDGGRLSGKFHEAVGLQGLLTSGCSAAESSFGLVDTLN